MNFISPYFKLMRLDKTTGVWLVLLPALWSASLFELRAENIYLVFLMIVGAVVMRSAGCVINDIYDRKIDAQVVRTKNRPLANGDLQLYQAFILLAALLSLGLLILLQFNLFTIWLGVAGLVPIMLYPLMKRLIWYPQIFLGFAINWGALIGWSAIEGSLALPAFLVYAACVFWTIAYDTIYAHQDKADDLRIGVKSTALRFGIYNKRIMVVCYIAMIILLLTAAILQGFSLFFLIAINIVGFVLITAVNIIDLDNHKACMALFKFNAKIGFVIWGLLLIDLLVSAAAG